MENCTVCKLPFTTRSEIEGMLQGGWTPEDLEHWIALRFRLKISSGSILQHYEQCFRDPPSGRELIEVARPEPGLVLFCLFPRNLATSNVAPNVNLTGGL